jgi:hypothetical protein
MSAKRIVIDTDRKKGQLFKVSESGGRFYAYKASVGFISDDLKKLGESRSLEDAIQIIKASVDGSVRDIKMSEW